MKTPLINQHPIISSRRNFNILNLSEATHQINKTSCAINITPPLQFISPNLNPSNKLKKMQREGSGGNIGLTVALEKHQYPRTSHRKNAPPAVSYVDMNQVISNEHFQRNLHHRAPTPQAMRPLSSSGTRRLTLDRRTDEMNTTQPLNPTNITNVAARPQTSKVVIHSKKYQTTRLIVNENPITSSNKENNQPLLNQQKPPKPQNSAKGMAQNKIQTIKKIVSIAMNQTDINKEEEKESNQGRNFRNTSSICLNLTVTNKENTSGNTNIKKDALMQQTEKVFQDFVKQNFNLGDKNLKKQKTLNDNQSDNNLIQTKPINNLINFTQKNTPKNDLNSTLKKKLNIAQDSNFTTATNTALQEKDDKIISRGMKLEKAIKQNQTYDQNNKKLPSSQPPIYRTQSQTNVILAQHKQIDLIPDKSNPLRSSQDSQNDPLLQKFLQKRPSIHDYEMGQKLGEGAYAVVRQCRHKVTNNKIAMKIYDKMRLNDPVKKRSVSREISLLQRLDHPNIVKFYESIDTNKTINLVMEHVKGKSLYSYLKGKKYRRVEEKDARQIFKQVVEGVNYLHKQNIAHRDLKPDNILIEDQDNSNGSENKVKIIDFGFSINVQGDKKLRTFCGTPSFMSPEIVSKKDYCGKQADIWALGVIMYSMIFGRTPFRAENERELYRKISKGAFYFPDEVYRNQEEFKDLRVSSVAKNLLKKILVVNGESRPTCDDILKDDWFKMQ